MRKKISVMLVLVMLLSLMIPSVMAEDAKSDDIVILHTNDVHSYIDGPLSYDILADIKDQLEDRYEHIAAGRCRRPRSGHRFRFHGQGQACDRPDERRRIRRSQLGQS